MNWIMAQVLRLAAGSQVRRFYLCVRNVPHVTGCDCSLCALQTAADDIERS